MSRPLRSTVSALLGALAVAAIPAVPALPVVQAVVSYDALPAGASLPAGVHVVTSMPALRMQVVRGDVAALQRLAAVPGVRGITADNAVQLNGGSDSGSGSSYFASAGLGGTAGQPGAGAGVRVAVIDTGVSDTPALNRASGRLIDAADTSTGKSLTGGVYTDGYGHGTFMADVIAGGPVAGTDGQALGVAPGATVLVVRVAEPDGTTSVGKVIGGLEWVAEHTDQVDVVNLSLSHHRPFREYGADPLTDAVEKVHDAGVTVVVSSGNRRQEVGDPGFDPKALTVGAADLSTNRVAVFSGAGTVAGVQKPEVVASGVHVLGMLPTGSVLEQAPGTTHLANGLFRGTGTSQAAAVASGLAAILLAAHPGATPAQVKASLRCAATSLRGDRDGAGRVNATTTLCAGPDGMALDGSGDATGEASFDASSWGASSWGASSWGASSWGASSWGASSWGASSWAASSWAASSWAASSWAASSWAASSWAASSWASDDYGDATVGGDE